MMQYNSKWIENLIVQRTSLQWFRKNLIDKEELGNIVSQTPTSYKEVNKFARIGFGIFTLIISLSALGLFSLFFMELFGKSGWIYFLIIAGIFFFIQKTFIQNRNYFSNGIDDMLQHLCVYAAATALGWMVFSAGEFGNGQLILFTALLCAVNILSAKYFVDSWLTALAFISFVVLQFFVFNKMGAMVVNFLPFILIITSYFVFTTAKKIQAKETLLPYFICLNVLQIVSLIMMYAAGNYFVVREGGHALLNQPDGIPMFLPFKIFFYAYTLITPVVLVNAGLKNKNSILVRLGIIFLLAGILTIKYYHSIMPIEDALIAGGILLMAITWFIIKKLKPNYKHITSEDTGENNSLLPQAEALLILNSFKMPVAKNDDMQFGGGSTGGGGATGGF